MGIPRFFPTEKKSLQRMATQELQGRMPETRINVTMTTTAGVPIPDNQNSVLAGARGPLLMQDYQLMQKYAHQNRERIPERTVHAKGSAAYGTLTITKDITHWSKAALFSEVGKKTPMLARFSVVTGESGAPDAERDVRGFAMKFYTEQGNWDLVCNNTPTFFVRDPLKFPDLIHSLKRHPRTNLRSNTSRWDFWSLSPESVHQVRLLPCRARFRLLALLIIIFSKTAFLFLFYFFCYATSPSLTRSFSPSSPLSGDHAHVGPRPADGRAPH